MSVLRTLKNLNRQVALALIFTLLFQSVAAAATLVNDTFADATSQNQELSNNSVRLFNGRAGTVRTDAAGSVDFNLAAAGGSEGFWGFFADGAPVTLGVGDRLKVSTKVSFQNLGANLGADLRFGLFDSKGTRTTANTTGGINSLSFSDDPGYATRLAGTTGGMPPFTAHRRVSPSATDPLANVISTAVAEYQALTVNGGSARAPLANGTPYTFTFQVERTSATETKVTVALTDGAAFNLSTTAPVIRSLTASPSVITQNNGKMVAVSIAAGVADAVDSTPTTRIVGVTGNENVTGDWQITGDLTLQLRAKRSGKTGRVYTVTVESRDDAGNVSNRTVTVTVR